MIQTSFNILAALFVLSVSIYMTHNLPSGTNAWAIPTFGLFIGGISLWYNIYLLVSHFQDKKIQEASLQEV